MGAMRHTRRNDPCRDGSTSRIPSDLTLVLGTCFDCNLETGKIYFFYREEDGLSS
jgi:hypothetical protein